MAGRDPRRESRGWALTGVHGGSPLLKGYLILRERSDRGILSAGLEPFPGKILRFARDEVGV